MDVISGLVAITGLISGVTKIATAVGNITQQWQYVSLNISMVSSSLWAVKAALEEIVEWRALSKDKSQKSEQLDTNLGVCIESCAVLVAVVENRLKDIDLENISKLDKARFLGLDNLFKDFSNSLGAQVRALQLLLTIYQCRTLTEQNEQLQRKDTRRLVRAVKESTASLAYEDKDIEDAASILSEASSTNFSFDKVIMQHQSYSRSYPILHQHIQRNFPYRNASVTSSSKPGLAHSNESLQRIEGPIRFPTISLPFLGVPFVGERKDVINEIENYSEETVQWPVLDLENDSTRATKNPEMSLSDPTLIMGIHSIDEAPRDIQRSTGISHHIYIGHLPISTSEQAEQLNVDQSPKDQPLNVKQPSKEFRPNKKASSDSLYDASDDDDDDWPVLEEKKFKLLDPIAFGNPQLAASSPSQIYTRSIKSMEDGNEIYDHTNLGIERLDTDVRGSISVINGSTSISIEPKVNQTEQVDVLPDTQEKSRATREQETSAPAAEHAVSEALLASSLSILDFNFGPDLDLQMTQHSPRDMEVRSIEDLSISGFEIDGNKALGPITTPDHTTESMGISRPNRSETSITVTSWRQNDDDDDEPEVTPSDNAELLNDLSQDQQSGAIINQVDLWPSDRKSPSKISSSDSITHTKARYSVDQGSVENTTVDSVTRKEKLAEINVVKGTRSSFGSEASGSFQALASPISTRSQHAASSSFSTKSTCYTIYKTPTTTTMTDPTLPLPRTRTDPVQHEKKRLAITSSLAKLSKRTITAPSRLSVLSAKLNPRATAKGNAKARGLARAVESDDVERVSQQLQGDNRPMDISIAATIPGDINPKTALMRAAASDNVEIARLLLGHDPSCAARTDEHGSTALHYALKDCSSSTALWLANHLCKTINGEMQFLGKEGQKVIDIQDKEGLSSAHLAVRARSLSVLEILHRGGANFSISDSYGKMPLHHAVESRSFDNVRYLIRQSLADVNKRSLKGETALMLAAGSNDHDSVSFLLKNGAGKDILDIAGNNALHHAARNGHIGVVEILFQSIEDVKAKNYIGEQPLHLAAAGNHTDAIIALLRIPGIEVDSWTEPLNFQTPVNRKEGFSATRQLACTPLHYACAAGHSEAAQILINLGAAINANQDDGYSPLMMACQAQNVAIASLLLLEGADTNSFTVDEGMTALHIACKVDDLACTKLLIQYGADVSAKLKNKYEDTPYEWAYRQNSINMKAAGRYVMTCRTEVLRAQFNSNGSTMSNYASSAGTSSLLSTPSLSSPCSISAAPSHRTQGYYSTVNDPPPPYRYR